ncbi:unnamed protein product, partial [Effrenium voratum]
YVRGIRARKWSFQLGQTYIVGRSGGCVDIEIDHASLSRKHCSLAITRVDSELVLVAMDHGSTNGTFINKSRLEQGVGLKMKVAEIKHLIFGECEHGYKFLVRETEEAPLEPKAKALKGSSGSGGGASAGPSQCELQVDAWARGEPAESEKPKKRPKGKGKGGGVGKGGAAGGGGGGGASGAGEKTGPNRKERRAAAREGAERLDGSKSAWRSAEPDTLAERVSKKRGPQDPLLNIEWPEEWK